QTASDFRVDLQRLRRESDSHPSAKSSVQAAIAEGAPTRAPSKLRRCQVLALTSCIVAIALIAGAYLEGKREGLASSITPPTYHQLTFRGGTIRMARFAPDGKNIVYSAAWEGNPIELLVTRPDSPESRPFGLSKAEVLSISSEGEMAILLHSHNIDPYINAGTLGRVPLGGGAPREVLENVQWADWSPDGTSFAVVREFGGLSRLEYLIAKDGRVLITRDVPRVGMVGVTAGNSKERDLSWLDWSAPKDLSLDGKKLLFTESGEAGGGNYSTYLRGTDGSPAVRLGDGLSFALSPDQRWVLSGLPKPPVQFN